MSTGLIVVSILGIIGIAFVGLSVTFMIHENNLRERCTAATIGVVIDFEERWSRSNDGYGGYVYHPIIQYEANGQIRTEVYNVGTRPPAYDEGQEIEVMYNRDRPGEFYLPGSNFTLVLCTIFGVIGLALLIIDGLLIFYRLRGLI